MVSGEGIYVRSLEAGRKSEPLEPEWWFTRGTRSVMRLLFYLPHSARPKDLNDGQDGREIGFCFRSICMRQLPA